MEVATPIYCILYTEYEIPFVLTYLIKGHKPSRKQLKVVRHKSDESGDMEESIVIVDKDKADEIEGLKSEVRNATEVITNKTATIVVKTEQVHLTREELLQTRIALMAKYLIHIISSCKLEIEEF